MSDEVVRDKAQHTHNKDFLTCSDNLIPKEEYTPNNSFTKPFATFAVLFTPLFI